jgi:hypothetical protein
MMIYFIFIFSSEKNKYNFIYKYNLWFSNESRSGPGSEIQNTKVITRILPNIINKYNIKTVLDIPCGDMNFMYHIIKKIPNINYKGMDIVNILINNNKKKYKNYNFEVGDIITSNLGENDLIIVKDLFIHFSNNNIKKALNNIKKSRSKYLLVNNSNFNKKYNTDIFFGKNNILSRDVNFMIDPWNLHIIEKYNDDSYDKNYVLIKL